MRHLPASLVAAFAFSLSAVDAGAVRLRAGDLVITMGGGLDVVNPASGAIAPIASLPPFCGGDITIGPDQDVYVLCSGFIARIDAETGASEVIASGGWLDDAKRIAREPSGTLVVLTYTDPPPSQGYPFGFHWSRIVRIDPTTGSEEVVSAGGFFDLPPTTGANAASDLDVLWDGEIVVSRGEGDPILFAIDPVTGFQSLITWNFNSGYWFPWSFAVDPYGRYAYGADSVNCWCTTQVDIASGQLSEPRSLNFDDGDPPAVIWDVTAAPDGTAYAIGLSPGIGARLIRRWNPLTQDGGILVELPDFAYRIEVVPDPILHPMGCGLGAEAALVLPALHWLRRRGPRRRKPDLPRRSVA